MNKYEKSPDQAGVQLYIMVPVYSEQANDDGTYDIIGYRKEYV